MISSLSYYRYDMLDETTRKLLQKLEDGDDDDLDMFDDSYDERGRPPSPTGTPL